MSAVEIECVLVPVDGSEQSREAVEYAVAIAERYGAAMHVLCVHDEGVARRLDTGEVDPETVAARTRAFVDTVSELAADHEVAMTHSAAVGFSPAQLTRRPGTVILDTADEIGADFVVVPREPAGGDPEDVLGKAAAYVLMHASQPVLSV